MGDRVCKSDSGGHIALLLDVSWWETVAGIHQEIIFEVNVRGSCRRAVQSSKGNQHKAILCADVGGK